MGGAASGAQEVQENRPPSRPSSPHRSVSRIIVNKVFRLAQYINGEYDN